MPRPVLALVYLLAGRSGHRRIRPRIRKFPPPERPRNFMHPRSALTRAIPTSNQAAGAAHFSYHEAMSIGITGPGRNAPRQNAAVGLIIAAVASGICLILLGLASDLLVDWLWFSSIGYLQVFLCSLGAKASLFFAVLTATGVILWLNGLL